MRNLVDFAVHFASRVASNIIHVCNAHKKLCAYKQTLNYFETAGTLIVAGFDVGALTAAALGTTVTV